MAFKQGNKLGGSRKGIPNKATKEIRDAFKLLVEDNLGNLKIWLSDVAAEDPERAIEILLKMSEFVLPKLQRQEIEHEIKDKQVIINITSTEDE
tara:strand:- start:326 stop:607 length:282 start_codon:yes stop_codon:yes gene_type:complete